MTAEKPLLPVHVQRDEDAALGAAWRRVQGLLSFGEWFDISGYEHGCRAVAYFADGGVASGESPFPASALVNLAETIEARRLVQ